MDDSRLKDWIRHVQDQTPSSESEGLVNISPVSSADGLQMGTLVADAPPANGAPLTGARVARRATETRVAASPAVSSGDAESSSAATEKERSGKQRVRLRPETRAQMLDRLTNPTISLHEASVILDVCPATVRRYTNLGVLPHECTTGGQRRFRLRTVMGLLRDLESKRRTDK